MQQEMGQAPSSLFSRAQSFATGCPFPLEGYVVAGSVGGGVAAATHAYHYEDGYARFMSEK
jgi:hypothetical protein